MKVSHIACLLAYSAIISACAYIPPTDSNARRVSPNYTATGNVLDARAYLYGNRTVLEFDACPAFLTIRDEFGESVEYEKVGQHYRLGRRVDKFTVWANGRSVTFSAVMTTRVFSAQVVPRTDVIKLDTVEPIKTNQADVDVLALLNLSQKQLEEVRQIIEVSNKNPTATGADLFKVNARLDEIEARILTAASVILQVAFPTAGTTFKPNADIAKVLINSAKTADRVNISGYTDARVAGSLDAKIALGRALSARKFLMENGIQAKKIKVFSQADGNFIAPNITKEGRALNRRVEIEIVNTRIAELKGQAAKLVVGVNQ